MARRPRRRSTGASTSAGRDRIPRSARLGLVHKFHDGPTYGYSYTWKLFERLVKQRPISILYETPGTELIQHNSTREILGVRAKRGEKSIDVKARKAVVLTCGG